MCKHCDGEFYTPLDARGNISMHLDALDKEITAEIKVNNAIVTSSVSVNYCPICGMDLNEE